MAIDPVVEAVRADLLKRSEIGIAKYGVNLARTDLSMQGWLQHAYEETLDLANYLKRVLMDLEGGQHWFGDQIRNWIEGMQPSDLRNRSIADLQDALQHHKDKAER